MSRNTSSKIYITAIAIIAIGIGATSLWLWSLSFNADEISMLPVLTLSVALAGRFPFKVSPQGHATLVTVPLFMTVLLLHPVHAALVAIIGTAISDRLLKAPIKAFAFNVSRWGLISGLAGVVFWSLRPDVDSGLLHPLVALSAMAAGVVIFVSILSLPNGMLTFAPGRRIGKHWGGTWAFEAILESSLLVIGLVGAILVASAWWMIFALVPPLVIAYYALSRSMSEVLQNTELAVELDRNLKELKEMQAQLIQSAKLAMVGTLAAGFAHEINNPRAVITARSDLLLARLNTADQKLDVAKALKGIQDMHIMAMEMSTIVSQLQPYSHHSEDLSEVSLESLIDDALAFLDIQIAQKSVTLERDYHHNPKVNVIANQLHQVFVNLVGNALDAIPESGTITLGCSIEQGVATAYVKDTGTGIPKAVRGKIFEPFFTTKELGQGTGLGLFICHKIMAEHHGELSVMSEETQGTTFYVKLPAIGAGRPAQEEPQATDGIANSVESATTS